MELLFGLMLFLLMLLAFFFGRFWEACNAFERACKDSEEHRKRSNHA